MAIARHESLAVPVALWPRLVVVSLLNVTAWMGLASFSLLWLTAAEATIVCYTMPVWAGLMAWAVLGERPGAKRIAGLALALAGLVALVLGKGVDVGLAKAPGVAFGLGSAILFSLGTVVTKRWPLGLPPTCSAVWQVGVGIAPLALGAMLFDPPAFGELSLLGLGPHCLWGRVRAWALLPVLVRGAAAPAGLPRLARHAAHAGGRRGGRGAGAGRTLRVARGLRTRPDAGGGGAGCQGLRPRLGALRQASLVIPRLDKGAPRLARGGMRV